MPKKIFLILAIFLMLISVGAVSAADVTPEKTAIKTGPNTATVTLSVNGSSSITTSSADVVFAIDSSGSMSTSDPTELRASGAKNFIDQMNSTKDKVGVVNWDNTIRQNQPLTNDFTLAKSVVDQTTNGGSTNMELAISTSIAQLDADTTLPADQKYIILLTDGVWNAGGNPLTAPDATPDATSKGYKIFTIGLGNGVSQTLLQNIADATGGKYYFASNANALNNIFNQIHQDINTAATNLVVTDLLPNYLKLDGNPTIQPNSIITNPDGTTTMIWNIGTLSKDQTWTVKYNLSSSRYGINLPTNIKGLSIISYTDPDGVQVITTLPVPVVSFEQQTNAENPVTSLETNANVNAANIITMRETGAPLTALILSMLMILTGMILPRRQ